MSQENLSAKFDELKALTQQSNNLLQGVINELQNLKSSTDTTNTLLVDLGDDIAALRLAIRDDGADGTTLRQAIYNLAGPAPGVNLTDLRNALIGASGDPTDLRQAIWNMVGPAPGRTLVEIYDALRDGLFTIPNPQTGIVSPYLLELSSLYMIIDKLNAAVGADPYQNLELASVRGFLSSLTQMLESVDYHIGETTDDNGIISVNDWLLMIRECVCAGQS
jgi:hypothetical protein